MKKCFCKSEKLIKNLQQFPYIYGFDVRGFEYFQLIDNKDLQYEK